jgi:type IV protein arginine methyltransferase
MTDEDVVDATTSLDRIRQIIAAAAFHDNVALQQCIDSFSFEGCKAVDVQEPDKGYTPLHAAIVACDGPDRDDPAAKAGYEEQEALAYETIKVLFENGAIWNQLDRDDETPGCIAHRLGFKSLYQLMVDAGVRAEVLLNRLDEYEELEDVEDLDESGEKAMNEAEDDEEPPQLVDSSKSDADPVEEEAPSIVTHDVQSTAYLSSTLSLDDSKLLDEGQNGVMMAWESDIMAKSADALLTDPGRKILNIGFGMGIIDSYIQSHSNRPTEHHIVEAHPDVLETLKTKGWLEKPGVTVHSGKWQDVLPALVGEGHVFDAIYYDTFAESYHDFKEFFSEHVIGLLDQDGCWSYFNGMGADRQISYDVYQKIVEIDLLDAGFDVEWTEIDLPDLGKEWNGVKRRYWNVANYRLPVCKFLS